MPKKLLRYVQIDRQPGSVYYYFRRPGFPRVRLPSPYGGAEFLEAYDKAMVQSRTL